MQMAHIFGLPAALLILAVVANRLSKLTRVPDIIVLLLIGITVGPVLHWIKPQNLEGVVRVLGTLALILILFEGGLELRLRQALRYFPAGLLLAILSFGLSLALIALVGRALLHLEWTDCLLLGAALGCTSGTIVIPALQQIETPDPVKITLTVESSLGEVIAVLMVGSLLKSAENRSLIGGLATDFSHHIVVSLLIGVAVGALWSKLWPRLAGGPYSNILNLGVVLATYALGDYFRGSGLLTVLISGVTIANLPRTPHMTRQGARMLAFHAEMSFLVRSFFFVLLGIVAQFVSRHYILPILGILAALVLARFLAVMGSRWVVRDVERQHTELLFWMLPRGLVTAVLALEIVNDRGAVFAFLPAMAFTVVMVTNLFIVWGSVRASRQAAAALAKVEPQAMAASAAAGDVAEFDAGLGQA
ncbi:MAG TPA: cation:proton antiporter [Terriglobales bacterium]|jgi:cell volume regulation protein A|nr:cation:proton antiporter [Terriglobales bacterium]